MSSPGWWVCFNAIWGYSCFVGIALLGLLVEKDSTSEWNYEERLYAVGQLGGFLRREGRPPEKAILTSRLIDRPLPPYFLNGCGMICK